MEVYKYNKKELRRKALNERRLCSKKFVFLRSLSISRKLANFLKLKNVKNVVSYNPINNEVQPNFFISTNVNVFFTKINVESLRIAQSKNFKKGKFSVLEPFCGTYTFKKQIECFIVPALAFDKRGYRIGYGMGFYDKLLQNSKALKIGVGFDFQVKDFNIKEDKFDVSLDYIITEKRILKCRR
ncbi:5-formyltetrahydrofolate cyclo-ligase [Desulfurella amilsii]|uniref:5-formyltetrahydrofolate cyclo-ligase n=1 Tax=Desulfurella amilsii TaxID=1562698 RepID=A0A1X4XWN4_9BACT|nr:5-formyltetrahydrofolate cyclo-ligase [Desulfurella amilsii]OSS41949.1 5-formyltetrahydrofolate cyclo-ligase [Desulfurella amilsii]